MKEVAPPRARGDVSIFRTLWERIPPRLARRYASPVFDSCILVGVGFSDFFSIKVSKTGLSPLSRSPHRPRLRPPPCFFVCAGLDSFVLVWRRTAWAIFQTKTKSGTIIVLKIEK